MIRPAMISITSVQALLMKARRQEIHMEYRQTAKGAGGARSATGARGLDSRRRTAIMLALRPVPGSTQRLATHQTPVARDQPASSKSRQPETGRPLNTAAGSSC